MDDWWLLDVFQGPLDIHGHKLDLIFMCVKQPIAWHRGHQVGLLLVFSKLLSQAQLGVVDLPCEFTLYINGKHIWCQKQAFLNNKKPPDI